MKKIVLVLLLFVGGCSKKVCDLEPLNYHAPGGIPGKTDYTNDCFGRAMVRINGTNCKMILVFINGRWAEKSHEQACYEDIHPVPTTAEKCHGACG